MYNYIYIHNLVCLFEQNKKSQRKSAGGLSNVIASRQAGIAYIKELQNGHGVCAVSANYAADLKRGWAVFLKERAAR